MFDLQGTDLLYVQAILLAASAIGASFAGLFKANSFVTQGVYDPKHESSYWVRFVVGLISGITLTQLIPINLDAVAQSTTDMIAVDTNSEANHAAIRITTALLGGFLQTWFTTYWIGSSKPLNPLSLLRKYKTQRY